MNDDDDKELRFDEWQRQIIALVSRAPKGSERQVAEVALLVAVTVLDRIKLQECGAHITRAEVTSWAASWASGLARRQCAVTIAEPPARPGPSLS